MIATVRESWNRIAHPASGYAQDAAATLIVCGWGSWLLDDSYGEAFFNVLFVFAGLRLLQWWRNR